MWGTCASDLWHGTRDPMVGYRKFYMYPMPGRRTRVTGLRGMCKCYRMVRVQGENQFRI